MHVGFGRGQWGHDVLAGQSRRAMRHVRAIITYTCKYHVSNTASARAAQRISRASHGLVPTLTTLREVW